MAMGSSSIGVTLAVDGACDLNLRLITSLLSRETNVELGATQKSDLLSSGAVG